MDSVVDKTTALREEIAAVKASIKEIREEVRTKVGVFNEKILEDRETGRKLNAELEEKRQKIATLKNLLAHREKNQDQLSNDLRDVEESSELFTSTLLKLTDCTDRVEIIPKLRSLVGHQQQCKSLEGKIQSLEGADDEPRSPGWYSARLQELREDFITAERSIVEVAINERNHSSVSILLSTLCNVLRVLTRSPSEQDMLEMYLRSLLHQANSFSPETIELTHPTENRPLPKLTPPKT